MNRLPINVPPADMTDGLRNFVAIIHAQLVNGHSDEAERMLVDLYEDIGGAYVCEEKKPEENNPVPDYDPVTNGDYSSWLASNNID